MAVSHAPINRPAKRSLHQPSARDLETGGGNSAFAAGMVLWTKDPDNFAEYVRELRGEMDNVPDDVIDAYAAGIAENLAWLRSLPGFSEDDVTISEYFEPGTGESCYPEYS